MKKLKKKLGKMGENYHKLTSKIGKIVESDNQRRGKKLGLWKRKRRVGFQRLLGKEMGKSEIFNYGMICYFK